jgi:hypothetical protein
VTSTEICSTCDVSSSSSSSSMMASITKHEMTCATILGSIINNGKVDLNGAWGVKLDCTTNSIEIDDCYAMPYKNIYWAIHGRQIFFRGGGGRGIRRKPHFFLQGGYPPPLRLCIIWALYYSSMYCIHFYPRARRALRVYFLLCSCSCC